MPSLKKLSRDTLNEKAEKLGIEGAEQLPNRAAVIEAIEARKAMGHTGIWQQGARAVSMINKGSRVLVEIPTELAVELFDELHLDSARRTDVIDAVVQELAAIRKEKPEVADSAIAATALRMAYELDNPYTSATAKSMCAKALHQAMDHLTEEAPPGETKKGRLDELREEREEKRRAAA